MRFDPAYFIDLCQQSGITLYREGPFLCYNPGTKNKAAESCIAEALRRHKNELMPLLPDTSPQIDLFDPYT